MPGIEVHCQNVLQRLPLKKNCVKAYENWMKRGKFQYTLWLGKETSLLRVIGRKEKFPEWYKI